MLAQECSVRSEEKHAAIKRSALAFNHAHHQVNGVGASCFAQSIDCGAGNFHGAFKVALEVFATSVRAPAHHGAKVEPTRITGDEGFRKENQLCALLSRIERKIQGLGQSSSAVKRN